MAPRKNLKRAVPSDATTTRAPAKRVRTQTPSNSNVERRQTRSRAAETGETLIALDMDAPTRSMKVKKVEAQPEPETQPEPKKAPPRRKAAPKKKATKRSTKDVIPDSQEEDSQPVEHERQLSPVSEAEPEEQSASNTRKSPTPPLRLATPPHQSSPVEEISPVTRAAIEVLNNFNRSGAPTPSTAAFPPAPSNVAEAPLMYTNQDFYHYTNSNNGMPQNWFGKSSLAAIRAHYKAPPSPELTKEALDIELNANWGMLGEGYGNTFDPAAPVRTRSPSVSPQSGTHPADITGIPCDSVYDLPAEAAPEPTTPATERGFGRSRQDALSPISPKRKRDADSDDESCSTPASKKFRDDRTDAESTAMDTSSSDSSSDSDSSELSDQYIDWTGVNWHEYYPKNPTGRVEFPLTLDYDELPFPRPSARNSVELPTPPPSPGSDFGFDPNTEIDPEFDLDKIPDFRGVQEAEEVYQQNPTPRYVPPSLSGPQPQPQGSEDFLSYEEEEIPDSYEDEGYYDEETEEHYQSGYQGGYQGEYTGELPDESDDEPSLDGSYYYDDDDDEDSFREEQGEEDVDQQLRGTPSPPLNSFTPVNPSQNPARSQPWPPAPSVEDVPDDGNAVFVDDLFNIMRQYNPLS